MPQIALKVVISFGHHFDGAHGGVILDGHAHIGFKDLGFLVSPNEEVLNGFEAPLNVSLVDIERVVIGDFTS